MRRRLSWLLAAVALGLVMSTPVNAQMSPSFKLGFKTLADQLPVEVVGSPTENEYFNFSNGNSEQHTSKGLMVWRKADNWTAYTNGYMTWINGPAGVQSRLNADRFEWETDTPAAQVVAAPSPVPTSSAALPAPAQQSTAPQVEWTVYDESSHGFKVALPASWAQSDLNNQDLASEFRRIFKDQPDGAHLAQVYAESAEQSRQTGCVFFAFPSGDVGASSPSTLFKVFRMELPTSSSLSEVVDMASEGLNEQVTKGNVSAVAHRRVSLPAGEGEEFTYLRKISLSGLPTMTVSAVEHIFVRDGVFYDLNFITTTERMGELRSVVDGVAQRLHFVLAPVIAAQSQPIKLVAAGFGQTFGANTGYGIIMENPNQAYAVEGTYEIKAYDASGALLESKTGDLGVVLPGQRLGIGDSLLMPNGARAAKIDVQLATTAATASPIRPFFWFSSVHNMPNGNPPVVTADIFNPYSTEAKDARVSVIAYNSAGAIIGGGAVTYSKTVPSRGMSNVTVPLFSSGPAARVELYAQPSAAGGMPW